MFGTKAIELTLVMLSLNYFQFCFRISRAMMTRWHIVSLCLIVFCLEYQKLPWYAFFFLFERKVKSLLFMTAIHM